MATEKIKILLVDDEKDILNILKFSLENNSCEVFECSESNQALALATKIIPDIFIIDVMMPHINGFDLCKKIKSLELLADKYVIFLTALVDEKNHIKGLALGADDYLLKPISMKVLQTKIENIAQKLRAKKKDFSHLLQFGNLTIDKNSYTVQIDQKVFVLAKKEFELLHLLASKKGSVFQRERILQNVWGTDVIVTERTIDVHVRKIRKKLGIDCIQTLKGIGYKFDY